MLELLRSGRGGDGVSAYRTTSQVVYNAASDALGQLTQHAVENAQQAAGRVAVAYQDARWLIGIAMVFAGVLAVGALIYISRSISSPLLHLARYMHRLPANATHIQIPRTQR